MILHGLSRPDFLTDTGLPDLLEATAARQPDRPALYWGELCLSYGELLARASLAAHHLLQAGAAPGQHIGLWMPRGAEALVMQAAITLTGAAWLPFDADTPPERVEICLRDAGALGLVCHPDMAARLSDTNLPRWTPEALQAAVDGPLRRREGLRPEHPAYVIYTSGSTGVPKGIAVSHGSICHFLRSENSVLGVREDDLVYQGFSLAFDMSFEEIWISYLVGAALWIAPKCLVSDPDALPEALIRQRVTVLHAVPSLLALFGRDVPNLRIINLGGEMCPQALVERWATHERPLFNTYGPTEATVSASLARLVPGQPVTIGQPLPNYGLLVVDPADMRLLPAGEVGELCIVGPGVASGYLGRPELTAEKFLDNPFMERGYDRRLYRTGDLAKIDETGQVQCLGRADDQVKIRGFRVELGEIEATLCDQADIGAAAVIVKAIDEVDQLIAYLVTDSGQPANVAALRAGLRERLPPYMVPALFITLDAMPRLTSGKVDRKALRARELDALPAVEDQAEPTNDAERELFGHLRRLFPGQPLAREADFFNDLGGHSLLAARLVSALRHTPRYAGITVQEIYRARTVGAMASALEQLSAQAAANVAPSFAAVSPLKRALCGLAQAAMLPPLVSLRMLQWLAPFFTYHFLTGEPDDSIALAVAASLLVFLLAHVASFAVAIAGKWLVLGRLKPGRYPLWGVTYFRWWLADRLADVPATYLLHGSPLLTAYWRAMGARIGQDTLIGSISLRAPDAVSIGAGVNIGASVNLENVRLEPDALVVGQIEIGDAAYVGSYGVLEGGSRIGAGAYLDGLSSLAQGQQVPAGERWEGAPARRSAQPIRPRPTPPARPGLPMRALALAGYVLGAAAVAALFFLPVFPSFILIDWLDVHELDLGQLGLPAWQAFFWYALLALPASAVLVAATILLSAAIRWLVLPRLQPGRWSVFSRVYYRKWLTNQIQESSLHVLHGLYATVFAPFWYRVLGARIGKGAEISTAMGVVPDMLTLGDDTFIADAVMLGDEEIDSGWMTLRPTEIGARSFVGNGAYLPDGTELPADVLIGVQSRAPANGQMRAGDTWMGSPALHLPAREVTSGFAEHLTFRPSVARRIGRGTVEAVRIVLPLALIIASGYLTVIKVLPAAETEHWALAAWRLCLAGLCYGVGSFAVVLAAKWLLIGRYTPRAAPMWTPFVWLSEAVTNLYESIAVPNFVNFLRGTPFLPWVLRLLGCQIGRGVVLDTTDVTEYDCVRIGDGSVLNAWSGPQTHLFEDRVMKIGRVDIGAQVLVGARTTVLYDSQVGDGALLGPLSLVMKGEHIPPRTQWNGSPCKPWTPPA